MNIFRRIWYWFFPPKTPEDIFGANLVGWYSASPRDLILDEEGRVVVWLDRSASRNHMIQLDPEKRPSYVPPKVTSSWWKRRRRERRTP